jgi:hypothetical protein
MARSKSKSASIQNGKFALWDIDNTLVPSPHTNSSGGSFRRGGMEKHWSSMHKDKPFPTHIYNKYGISKPLQSQPSMMSLQ